MKQGYGRDKNNMYRHSDGSSYSSAHNQMWENSVNIDRGRIQYEKIKKPVDKVIKRDRMVKIKIINKKEIKMNTKDNPNFKTGSYNEKSNFNP